MSAEGMALVIAAVGLAAVQVITAWKTTKIAATVQTIESKTNKVSEINASQVKQLDNITILVDGRMTAAIRSIARLSRTVAKLTNDPDDVLAADLAESELRKKYETDQAAKDGVS